MRIGRVKGAEEQPRGRPQRGNGSESWPFGAGGAPVGSACEGTLRLYDDAACGSEFDSSTLSSVYDQCVKLVPPGRALGGKAITDYTYIQGACEPSGGEAIGEAQAKPEDAVTFCCLPPFYDVQ
jgi:hypothetical protein